MVVELFDRVERFFHQALDKRLKFAVLDLLHARVEMLAVRGDIFAVQTSIATCGWEIPAGQRDEQTPHMTQSNDSSAHLSNSPRWA